MFKTEKQSKRFNFTKDEDVKAYEEILNNPLASVFDERKIRETEKHFDSEGNPTHTTIIDWMIISWEVRSLL